MYDPERLKFYMEKRIQTTMIGALARIEKNFGYLWGSDKPDTEPLTDKEQEFFDLWEYLRNDILNYGNSQIRKVKEDFYRYGGAFKNKYSYKFPITKNTEDQK
jgi:hypothetical protein